MFTWNLPALIRNVVLFTLLCIILNWNFMAWIFILFLMFIEMDEELTKYENYSDYYTDQLQTYDFSHVNNNGWNLEEQLRIYNQQNPEVVQEYQRTFNSRIQELRKRPTKTKPQDKAKIRFNKKEEIRVKQEVFGYTENYWDEPDPWPTNEYVEVMNHISSTSMYEWYHQNGLIIPEQEYGIKNISLYYDKYADKDENQEYKDLIKHNIYSIYKIQLNEQNKACISLHKPIKREIKLQPDQKLIFKNNLLYWPMSDYQKAKYNQYTVSIKTSAKHIDTRANHIQHIKSLLDINKPSQLNTKNSVYKQIQLPLQFFKEKYKKPLYKSRKNPYMDIDYHIMALLSQKTKKKKKS